MQKSDLIDRKALALLKRYDVIAELVANGSENLVGLSTRPALTSDEWAYLIAHGMAFHSLTISHDEAVEKCFAAYTAIDKQKVVDLFVSGLGTGRLDWCSGLGAYALMQSMPRHAFKPNAAGICEVCSGASTRNSFNPTHLNQNRFFIGGFVLEMSVYEIQFLLSQHDRLPPSSPSSSDRRVLASVLDTARDAEVATTASGLQKSLKRIGTPKMTNNQLRCLIETLGLCGVLQTRTHRGYLEGWTNPGLAPHKSHSSDWAYPVDFWTGKDGVNKQAVDFWFGDVLN